MNEELVDSASAVKPSSKCYALVCKVVGTKGRDLLEPEAIISLSAELKIIPSRELLLMSSIV